MTSYFTKMKSPVGELTLVANDKNLIAVSFPNDKTWGEKSPGLIQNKNHPILKKARTQLMEYFEGERLKFDLPLEFEGTSFQKKVWAALRTIPYGKTFNYSEIAR